MCVTRYRSMFLKTSSASNAGMTTLVAPSEVITKATTPAACESGALVRQTRSVVSPAQYWPAISVMVPHARSVTITPLAAPVVPPVGTRPIRRSGFPYGSPQSISATFASSCINLSSDGFGPSSASMQIQCRSVGTRALRSSIRSR